MKWELTSTSVPLSRPEMFQHSTCQSLQTWNRVANKTILQSLLHTSVLLAQQVRCIQHQPQHACRIWGITKPSCQTREASRAAIYSSTVQRGDSFSRRILTWTSQLGDAGKPLTRLPIRSNCGTRISHQPARLEMCEPRPQRVWGVGGVCVAGAVLGRRIKVCWSFALAIEHCALSNTFLHTLGSIV